MEPLLALDAVESYYGESHILKSVSLTVGAGETVALLGRNGAGKTTTLKSIVGWVQPRSGSVKLAGEELAGSDMMTIARKGVALVPEERRIFTNLTVADNLRENYHRTVLAIRALEKPVIAAVNGPAAGAGMSLAFACDVRIASDAASFVPAFVNIGLVPDSGGSWLVRRGRARRAHEGGRGHVRRDADARGLGDEAPARRGGDVDVRAAA